MFQGGYFVNVLYNCVILRYYIHYTIRSLRELAC